MVCTSPASAMRRLSPTPAGAPRQATPSAWAILTKALLAIFLFVGNRALAQPVGSYSVNSGPNWTTNPPTYSCVEACALLFGGSPAGYACSTSNSIIDHMAFVDGWGDDQFCFTPVAETFKVNTFYDCGDVACSYSAYVSDHSCLSVNYCWNACNHDGAIDAGESCDDGNLIDDDGCSDCQADSCYGCTGEPSTCLPLTAGSACPDEGEPCTAEACDGAGLCVHTALPDETSCDDTLYCNGTDTCLAGACSQHTGDPCAGGAECNNVCNETNDTCLAPNFSPCTDDGNACTADQCNGLGSCTHPNDDFIFCNDGLFCNGQDLCLSGTCSFHFGDPCIGNTCNDRCDEPSAACLATTAGTFCFDDGNICTGDQCDGLGACVHPPVPNGTACASDGNTCTTDQCSGGVCAHPPVASGIPCANDGNPCTADQCNGAGSCAHPPVANGTVCNDSSACTQTDQCQAGTCVGTNPIVCPAPACHEPGTCDPSTGICSTCPAGYTPGGGGCQKTYAIDASLLDNLGQLCGNSAERYNDCVTAFGFHWTDAADDTVGSVARVDVQLQTGVDCADTTHLVSLNGSLIGNYPNTNSCTCFASVVPRVLADVDVSGYVKEGINTVEISTGDCTGLTSNAQGSFALVTVTYEDPGPLVEARDNCRPSMKSKLKYKNDATGDNDVLNWKWSNGVATTQGEFADPTDSADYEFCMFAERSDGTDLLAIAEVPADDTRWKPIGSKGYKYKDTTAMQGGISKIVAKGGADGKAKIVLKGKGSALSDPTLPLAPGTAAIRVQLTNPSSGVCWESEFPFGTVSVDDTSIKGKVP